MSQLNTGAEVKLRPDFYGKIMSEIREQKAFAGADIYRLLSACYYQPEDAFLQENVFGQMASALALTLPQEESQADKLATAFNHAGVDNLLLDYTRLFLGPFGILAKPYGSIYLDGEKQVMGDSTMRALSLYREGGFDLDESFREAPDHVAVELEFLYLLTHRIGEARLSGDQAETARLTGLKRQFLGEHLGRWIGNFADKVRAGAETDYFRELAELTQRFVQNDIRELERQASTP